MAKYGKSAAANDPNTLIAGDTITLRPEIFDRYGNATIVEDGALEVMCETKGSGELMPLRYSQHYFGTGETFLFSIHPEVAVYRWTRRNAHYVLGGHNSLAFGGGGAFGLHLDSSFERGSSGRCDTFDNAALGSSDAFRVVKVEVWGFSDSR